MGFIYIEISDRYNMKSPPSDTSTHTQPIHLMVAELLQLNIECFLYGG